VHFVIRTDIGRGNDQIVPREGNWEQTKLISVFP
jgi:hypothetical protein